MSHRAHLAVALDGAGWHPAAWRESTARPTELTSAGYWRDLARLADDAGVLFATIEDALSLGGRLSKRMPRPGATARGAASMRYCCRRSSPPRPVGSASFPR